MVHDVLTVFWYTMFLRKPSIQLLFTYCSNRSERKYNFRKQVYLEVAEGIKNGSDFLANIIRLDIDDKKLGDIFREARGWAFRFYIVASQETIEALNKAFYILFTKTIGLMKLRIDIRNKMNQISSLQQEAAQISKLFELALKMTPTLPEPTQYEKQTVVPLIIDIMKTKKERLSLIYSEIAEIQNSVNILQIHLSKEGLISLGDYQQKISEVIISLRRELKHKLDENKYRSMMSDNSIKVDEAIDKLIRDLAEK